MFYWPGGEIQPEHGIQKMIPNHLVDSTETNIHVPGEDVILAFSSNGQILIKLNRSNGLVEEILWLKDTVMESPPSRMLTKHTHTRQGLVYLRAISQTARFMVYETPFKDDFVVFHILDYQGNLRHLHVGGPRPLGSTVFRFSQDDQFLLGIAFSDWKAQ